MSHERGQERSLAFSESLSLKAIQYNIVSEWFSLRTIHTSASWFSMILVEKACWQRKISLVMFPTLSDTVMPPKPALTSPKHLQHVCVCVCVCVVVFSRWSHDQTVNWSSLKHSIWTCWQIGTKEIVPVYITFRNQISTFLGPALISAVLHQKCPRQDTIGLTL